MCPSARLGLWGSVWGWGLAIPSPPLCPAPLCLPSVGHPLAHEGPVLLSCVSASFCPRPVLTWGKGRPRPGICAVVPRVCGSNAWWVRESELPARPGGQSDLEVQGALLTEWQTAKSSPAPCGLGRLWAAPCNPGLSFLIDPRESWGGEQPALGLAIGQRWLTLARWGFVSGVEWGGKGTSPELGGQRTPSGGLG